MATGNVKLGAGLRLIDAHCHLQDPRIFGVVPTVISTATRLGVQGFVVNGTSEEDWQLVKQLNEREPTVLPSFGVHPWFAHKCSPSWLSTLTTFLSEVPSAAIGEIGLDKGCKQGKAVDYGTQIDIFKQQLELAKKLQRPASIHCVSAFSDLLDILRQYGPFPAGIVLHSYMGSAELVEPLASLGAYFSFSGFLTSLKPQKAKRILQMVPPTKMLLETDAPDALPRVSMDSLFWVPGDPVVPEEIHNNAKERLSPIRREKNNNLEVGSKSNKDSFPMKALNHPANLFSVLQYVSSLIEQPEEQVAELCYTNTVRLFSFQGSKFCGYI